ncbi:hypothetical protein K426_05570 [Sphingobium sp. TKS]|nr:hypothetical protein K426_05570 [Sphingobium sp. TKS]
MGWSQIVTPSAGWLQQTVGYHSCFGSGVLLHVVHNHPHHAQETARAMPDIVQNAGEIMLYRSTVIKTSINPPESLHADCARHVPHAMIAKAPFQIAISLGGEQVGKRTWSKAHPFPFEPRAIGAPDSKILGMGRAEPRMEASLKQAPAAKGKAAIAYIMAIIELRPTRADIVIIEKLRTPSCCVEHMTIPLDYQAMGSGHIIHHPRQNKFGIGCGGVEPRDGDDGNFGMIRPYGGVS